MPDITSLFVAGSSATVFLGYVGKKWLESKIEKSVAHRYDVELESHKAELKQRYDLQLENFKATIQMANIKFSHMYGKQAEALVLTYQKLIPLFTATIEFTEATRVETTDQTNRREKAAVLNKSLDEFHEFFRMNAIFINFKTSALVNNFVKKLTFYTNKHSMLLSMNKSNYDSRFIQDARERTEVTIEELSGEVDDALDAILENFQTILGINAGETKTLLDAHK